MKKLSTGSNKLYPTPYWVETYWEDRTYLFFFVVGWVYVQIRLCVV